MSTSTPIPNTPSPARVRRNERRPVAAYDSYREAERAVDYLSDNGFPVERVAIVGSDLKLVEQVVGRLNYGSAALRGAAAGAFAGLLIGWLFGILSWAALATLALALYGLLFGAVLGAIFGLIMHALQGGRRDFASVQAMTPDRYEVVVDEEVADQAHALVAKMSGAV